MKKNIIKTILSLSIFAVGGFGQQFTVNLPRSLADSGAAVQIVKAHLNYSEGPVVDKNGNLFFSEQGMTTPATTLWKITPDGTATQWRTGINTPNGNDFYINGHMFCCENTRIVEVDSTGAIVKTIVSGSSYGKLNDLSIASDGGLFFSNNASNFWFMSKDGAITTYSLPSQGPNGIEYLEEKHRLYVNLLYGNKVLVYNVGANHVVDTTSKKTFVNVNNPDGLTVDDHYNVWVASNSGSGATAGSFVVFDSLGDSLGKIVMRQDNAPAANASNCVFGNFPFGLGTNPTTLYLTGDSGCFKILLKISGRVRPAAAFTPTPAAPSNGSNGLPVALTLSWGSLPAALTYGVQLATDASFSSTTQNAIGLAANTLSVSGLAAGTTYFWKVNASNAVGTSSWSPVWSFTTAGILSLSLAAGWNMKSISIHPVDSSASTVFGSGKSFYYVKDIAGNQYCPALSENQIGQVRTGQGYQIYTDVPDTLKVLGTPLDYATTPIALNSGWNMIGYLPWTNDSAWHALAGIKSLAIFVKDNGGNAYWPSVGIDGIGVMAVGEGYKVLMSAAATLTYPVPLTLSKQIAGSGGSLLYVPAIHHYAAHANTGNNATILAKSVMIDGNLAPDNSEIAVYGVSGNFVGAGSVKRGLAAFPVWGNDPFAKQNGCVSGEKLSFKLWNGVKEYPLSFAGGEAKYAADGIFLGSFRVSEAVMITKFALSRVYPNPFRGLVRIAFDIPAINGVSEHEISIAIYDLKGSLVKQLAKGKYQAGHYELPWQGGAGSGAYIVQMKAAGFDKRIKLVRMM